MAVFSSVFGFTGDATQKVSALAVSSSSAEIVLGNNALFAIMATGAGSGDFHLAFGNAGMAAASAANFRFPGKQVFTLNTGDHTDRIRVFNPDTVNTLDVYVQRLDRF
jgi:hypothetical protein